jgi:hypothetical protein
VELLFVIQCLHSQRRRISAGGLASEGIVRIWHFAHACQVQIAFSRSLYDAECREGRTDSERALCRSAPHLSRVRLQIPALNCKTPFGIAIMEE